jgi:hypothetical protein
MAGRDGSFAVGCGTERANDVRADWRDASDEPARRAGVRQLTQRHALGKAEAGEGYAGLSRLSKIRLVGPSHIKFQEDFVVIAHIYNLFRYRD